MSIVLREKSLWYRFLEAITPSSLMFLCPTFCIFCGIITNRLAEPTFAGVADYFVNGPGLAGLLSEYFANFWGFASGFKIIAAFHVMGMALYYIPAPKYNGPMTVNGHIPVYINNGFRYAVAMCVLYGLGSEYCLKLYKASVLYDEFIPFVVSCNTYGLLFCVMLYFKGLYAPSTPPGDSGHTGKGFLFDYYWGTDLYPRIFGFDVKLFINSRFSMMYWTLMSVSCIFASYNKNGFVDPGVVLCGALQWIYMLKFFWWEAGYMGSIDIIVDRAGWMETWGCIVWVPAVYTFHTRCLVNAPSGFTWLQAGLIFGLGIAGVFLNYFADWERQYFRATDGKAKIWGRLPTSINVDYVITNHDGTKTPKKSILLTSGFWGVSRHFQYVFELTAAYSWCALANNGIAMFYAVFLTILLIHRAHRDEEKCLKKYGEGYKRYMAEVKYKIIPFIY